MGRHLAVFFKINDYFESAELFLKGVSKAMKKMLFVFALFISLLVFAFGCNQGQEQAPLPPVITLQQPVAPPPPQPAAPAPVQPVAQPQPQPEAAVPAQPVVPPPPPPAPTGDALVDKLNLKRSEVIADWKATSSIVKHRLVKNQALSYQVQLPGPPFCHTFIAAGGDELKNLDLSLATPAGAETKDSTEEPLAVVNNQCPTAPGSYRLTVSAPQGSGEFAIQVFSK